MANRLLLSELLTEEQCHKRVSDADIAAAAEFSSLSRRREYLTWRAMLYEALDRRVSIAYEDGAPIGVGENIYIGVSHTTDMAAVVISENPCAVDVERADRDVSRVASRFFTERERQLAADSASQVAVWCARECCYKYCRNKQLDILGDIGVTELDMAGGSVTAEVKDGLVLKMRIEQTADHIVVSVL